jgi:TonB family protein
MFKRLICLFLAMTAAALAATPPQAVQRPVAVGTPHVCMNDYPESAIWDGAEGTAQVAFRIGADGKVKDVTLVKSTGHEDLDAATLGCVGRWAYKPFTQDGVAVEMPWRAEVHWKLHRSYADMHPCANYLAVTPQLLAGIGGVTRISFRIMPDGTAKDPEVVRSSGNGELDKAAQRCIGGRHFNTMRAVIPDAGVPKEVQIDWRNDLAPAK